jgi:hypothetical protein
MTLSPLLTLSHRHQVKDNFIILQKVEYSNVFRWRLGYRQHTVVTLIREVLPRQKLVSAAAKPLRSVPPFSRLVFSAQESARQKLKIRPEPSGNKLSESVFKNSVLCL